MKKNTICLWYDHDAEEAARFYARTFPDSTVGAVHRAPSDFPSGKAGDVLTVEFTVCGVPCLGLNGGPVFKHNKAFSFQIATDDQAETDRYWNAIVGSGGGQELARRFNVPLLGQVPLSIEVREGGDAGVPIVIGDPESLQSAAFREIADNVATQITVQAMKGGGLPVINLSDNRGDSFAV